MILNLKVEVIIIMNKKFAILVLIILIFPTTNIYAFKGYNGFEGGISSGSFQGRMVIGQGVNVTHTFPYKEFVFITGEPILFSGEVDVTIKMDSNKGTLQYNYKLNNGSNNSLTRRINYNIENKISDKQLIQTVSAGRQSSSSEKVQINDKVYTLERYDFSMSTVRDARPISDYYSGNISAVKTYKEKKGEIIKVDLSGQVYGYSNYWGETETQEFKVYISSEKNTENIRDVWNGSITINLSSVSNKNHIFIENRPNEISFTGGYLERQDNVSIMRYRAELPRFDKHGISTDSIKTYRDEINLENFPINTRLKIFDINSIKGYWYEEPIKKLFSLGILDEADYNIQTIKPNEFIQRSDFAKVVALVSGYVPEIQTDNRTARRKTNAEIIESPFKDVETNDLNYSYINYLYVNGVMGGVKKGMFEPQGLIDRAQAITIFIRMLGFENLHSRSVNAITTFKDNGSIPDWARDSVESARTIGLITGDENGNFNPSKPLTLAEASILINRFINYLSKDMVKEYRDRIFTY